LSNPSIASPPLESIARPLRAAGTAGSTGAVLNRSLVDYGTATASFGIAVPVAATIWLLAMPLPFGFVGIIGLTLLATSAAAAAFAAWRKASEIPKAQAS